MEFDAAVKLTEAVVAQPASYSCVLRHTQGSAGLPTCPRREADRAQHPGGVGCKGGFHIANGAQGARLAILHAT